MADSCKAPSVDAGDDVDEKVLSLIGLPIPLWLARGVGGSLVRAGLALPEILRK